MIWSDGDIKEGIGRGTIVLHPFEEKAVQPASADLRLGDVFYRFKRPSLAQRLLRKTPILEPRKPVKELMERIQADEIIIPPYGFLLGVTKELVGLPDYVMARVEGKSSLGRLGLSVHVTAGFVDPGFSGHITLEMFNCSPLPIKLQTGMWICQLAFHEAKSRCDVPYGEQRGSRYTDQSICEPIPSRIHEKLA